jgi:SAM-dependent methyltransferase
MNYLNLGCGSRFHPDWNNVDFTSTGLGIIAHNLALGVPFSDTSLDVVYHSHILEHFPKTQAPIFLQECYRVLKPHGIIRIAIPDLEQIIRSYVFALEQAISGSAEAVDNYNWLLLELFDQMVRDRSGGDMAAYFLQDHIPNEAFILKRLGTEAKKLIESGLQPMQNSQPPDPWFNRTFRPAYQFLRDRNYRREIFLRLLLGSTEYETLQIGRFRQSGEIHQWMYDRYSLARLLEECGFKQIVQRTATESYIPNWSGFNLDTEPDGSVYKPDSLFMEAIKPA